MQRLRFVVFLVPAIAIGAVLWLRQGSGTDEHSLPEGVSSEAFDVAAREFEAAQGRRATFFDTLDWLGEREARNGSPALAEACFAAIPVDHPRYGRAARHQRGQVLLRLDRAVEAEREFRTFLDLELASRTRSDEEIVDAIRRLRYILEVELRFEERADLIRRLVESDAGNSYDTMFYCFPDLLFWNGTDAFGELREFHANDPDDPNLTIAHGRFLVARGQLAEGADVLRESAKRWPDDLRAVAGLLEYLDLAGETEALDDRLARLPPVSDEDPWLLLRLRGEYHNRIDEPEVAIDCFQRLLAEDPANNSARQGLAVSYRMTGRNDLRERVLTESSLLTKIQNLLGRGQTEESDADTFLAVARLAAEAGLVDRALYVARLARRLDPESAESKALVTELETLSERSSDR